MKSQLAFISWRRVWRVDRCCQGRELRTRRGDQDNLSAHSTILCWAAGNPTAFRWSDLSLFHQGRLPSCARHDGEARALVLGRADLDAVSEQIRRMLHNEEPEPETVRLAFLGPLESPEDRRQRAGADADAGVAHRDAELRAATARREGRV